MLGLVGFGREIKVVVGPSVVVFARFFFFCNFCMRELILSWIYYILTSCTLSSGSSSAALSRRMMWWNVNRSDNISPSNTEILYGYKPEAATFYALNHYLLITKYHVFLARNRSETPNLKVCLALLDSKIKCERQIAIKNSNYEKCRAKWTTLSNNDA